MLKCFFINQVNVIEKTNASNVFKAIFVFGQTRQILYSTDDCNCYLYKTNNNQFIKQVNEDYHFSLYENCTVLFGHLITTPMRRKNVQYTMFSFLTKEFYTRYEQELELISEVCNLMVFIY